MYIGNTNIINSPYSVWKDDRTDRELRQNERLILSRLDLLSTYYGTLGKDSQNRNAVNNLLVIYYIELQLIKEFGENDDYLYRAGVVLSNYVDDILSRSFSSEQERNNYILNILDDIKRRTINGTTSVANIAFMGDWTKDVYNENYYIDFSSGVRTMNLPSGAISDADESLTDKFKEVAGNLVYCVVPYSAMTTQEAKKKRILQTSVLSGVCASGFGFTEAICNNYIQSSIIGGCGLSPSQYVESLKELARQQYGSAQVGDPATLIAVLTLVGKLLAILASAVTIFKVIWDARKNTSYRDSVQSLEKADLCGAEIPDWLKLGDLDGDGKDDTLKVWGALLAVGAFAYLYTDQK